MIRTTHIFFSLCAGPAAALAHHARFGRALERRGGGMHAAPPGSGSESPLLFAEGLAPKLLAYMASLEAEGSEGGRPWSKDGTATGPPPPVRGLREKTGKLGGSGRACLCGLACPLPPVAPLRHAWSRCSAAPPLRPLAGGEV